MEIMFHYPETSTAHTMIVFLSVNAIITLPFGWQLMPKKTKSVVTTYSLHPLSTTLFIAYNFKVEIIINKSLCLLFIFKIL